MARLTKPQVNLLKDLVIQGRSNACAEYPPRKKLLALGYAHEHFGRLGGSWITPTPEGRCAFEELARAAVAGMKEAGE